MTVWLLFHGDQYDRMLQGVYFTESLARERAEFYEWPTVHEEDVLTEDDFESVAEGDSE